MSLHLASPSPPPPPEAVLASGQPEVGESAATARAKRGKRERRAKKRAAAKEDPFVKKVRASLSKRLSQVPSLKGKLDATELPIARGAFVGSLVARDPDGVQTVDELRAAGYEVFDWDGSTPYTLLDRDGRVIALLAGHPQDPQWGATVEAANCAMEEAYRDCTFTREDKVHRRGTFATLARGVSFGGGRTTPGNISNSKKNEAALRRLCDNHAIKRLAGFGTSMLATYAPRIFANTQEKLKQLYDHHPTLKTNFQNSIYPAASFNFGPATACVPHTDAANDAVNWCHIVALGRYDPDKGGHVVLRDFKLVIRFPSGSSIMIPSAIICHANTPIQPNETRMSFTQYCAGGLLRWVECGFRTVKTFAQEDPEAFRAYEADLDERTRRSCEMFHRL
ncbi:hypothetical protein FKP32DRAFT_1680442 [Trametes sanguinea]|nr:hypothetical protein FKP32DRAFT_1680442 [Trametes sanguinea]